MRFSPLASAFKRLGVQGLVRSDCQQRSRYDEIRVVCPLFSKYFSSAEYASVDTEEPLKESGGKGLSKDLYWTLCRHLTRPATSVLEKWVNGGKKLEKDDLHGLVRGLHHAHKYKKALEVCEV